MCTTSDEYLGMLEATSAMLTRSDASMVSTQATLKSNLDSGSWLTNSNFGPPYTYTSTSWSCSATERTAYARTTYTVTATNDGGYSSASVSIQVVPPAPTIDSSGCGTVQVQIGISTSDGCLSVPADIDAAVSIDPPLPTGLGIDPSTGIISGVVDKDFFDEGELRSNLNTVVYTATPNLGSAYLKPCLHA